MIDFIETIRTAIAADATVDARAAGAQACRTLLTALDPPAPAVEQAPVPPVASIVAAMRRVLPDQLCAQPTVTEMAIDMTQDHTDNAFIGRV